MVDLTLIFHETLANKNNIYTSADPKRLICISELISSAYLNNDNVTRKEAENQLETMQTASVTLHLQELFQIIFNLNVQNTALEERVII